MQTYSVIMAGGGGTRFWPLSRQCHPKHLLNLSGNDFMINETIKRNQDIIPAVNTYIVTNKSQEETLKQVLMDGVDHGNILIEPVGRNTTACIGFAAAKIQKAHGDSLLCIFPSDAYINRLDEYSTALEKAVAHAASGEDFVTLGIEPGFAATGYGYIKYERSTRQGDVYRVEEFVEKPGIDKAKSYVKSGKYLWNSGIIVSRSSVVLKNIERYLPRLFKQLEALSQYFGTDREAEMTESIYPQLQSISFDYGVLERSDDVMVIPGNFGWNDVGSWDMLGVLVPPDEDGNIIKSEHIGIDTKNSIIYGKKLIATIGLENMIVVNTDDSLLICPKSRAQEVKEIVELLREKGNTQYL